jgi:putative flippase GtrA
MFKWLENSITSLIDFFYPPFRRFIPAQTFRYLVCGGGNTVLDILIYYISYNFILQKQVVHIGHFPFLFSKPLAVSPHIMSFFISFSITFPLGFYLMRTVVFHDSNLKGRVQLFRYIVLVTICILLNIFFIKLFVEKFAVYPTVAKILTTAIVVSFSYLAQRNYTFRKKLE